MMMQSMIKRPYQLQDVAIRHAKQARYPDLTSMSMPRKGQVNYTIAVFEGRIRIVSNDDLGLLRIAIIQDRHIVFLTMKVAQSSQIKIIKCNNVIFKQTNIVLRKCFGQRLTNCRSRESYIMISQYRIHLLYNVLKRTKKIMNFMRMWFIRQITCHHHKINA